MASPGREIVRPSVTVNDPRTVRGPGGATEMAWKNALGEYEPESEMTPPGPTDGEGSGGVTGGGGSLGGDGGEGVAFGLAGGLGAGAAGDDEEPDFSEDPAFAGGSEAGGIGLGAEPGFGGVYAVVYASAVMTGAIRLPDASRTACTS